MKKIIITFILFSLYASTSAFADGCSNCESYIIFKICDCSNAAALTCGKVCDEDDPSTCSDGAEIGIRLRSLTTGVYWANKALQNASILSVVTEKFQCSDCVGGPLGNRSYDSNKDGYYRWTQWLFKDINGNYLLESDVAGNEDYDYSSVNCDVLSNARFTELTTADANGTTAGYKVDCDDGGWWAINLPSLVVDWAETRDHVGEVAQVKVMLIQAGDNQLCSDCVTVCECIIDLFTISDTTPLEVSTATASLVTSSSAVCGGSVKQACNPGLQARGICWSTSHNPTTADSYTVESKEFGSFTTTITDLEPYTTYYVRAYATNKLGTSYGDEVSFTTLCPSDQTVYIPHLTPVDSEWLDYLQVDNSSLEDACFTLKLYDTETVPYTYGAMVYSKVHTVPALGRSVIDLKSLSSKAQCGRILFGNPDLLFRLSFECLGGESYTGGGLAEYKLTSGLSDHLNFYFSDFASSLTVKGAVITNLGNDQMTVSLSAMGGGQVLGTYSATLDPYSKLTGQHSDWFPEVGFSDIERMVVESSSPTLIGIVNNSDAMLTNLVTTTAEPDPLDSSRVLFYIPHITSGYPDWTDRLQVDSSVSTDTIFTLFLYADGKTVFNKTYTMPAMGRLKLDLKSLSSTAECGMLSSREPGLFCRLSFENTGGTGYAGGGLSEFKLTDTLSRGLSFNFSDFAEILTTKAAVISNLTQSAVAVTLKAIGNGEVLETYNTSIGGRDTLFGSYSNWFPGVAFSDIDRIIAETSEEALCGIVQNTDPGISTIVFTMAEPVSSTGEEEEGN